MTKAEREKIERALAWLKDVKPEYESPETRIRVARAELEAILYPVKEAA